MKAPDFYLNNYIADELRAAFDKEDVCISYSGDYEPETLNQVHNSCEILFVEEGEADQEMYKEKMASRVGREYRWFKNGLKAQKLLAQGNALGTLAVNNAPCKGKSFV